MKIKEIKEENGIFTVTVTPSNWFDRLFKRKEKTMRFKDGDRVYDSGSQTLYIREDGSYTDNNDWISEEIDKWRRKF